MSLYNIVAPSNENSLPRLWTKFNQKNLIIYTKSTATVMTIGLAVIGSTALVYHAPGYWFLTTLTTSVISFYSLPKIWNLQSSHIIQIATAVSFVALGSLVLGGVTVSSFCLGSMLAFDVKKILLLSILFTGFTGYGLPLATNLLNRAYKILRDPLIKEKLELLQTRLNQSSHAMRRSDSFFANLNLFIVLSLLITLKVDHPLYEVINLKIMSSPKVFKTAAILLSVNSLRLFEQTLKSFKNLSIEYDNLPPENYQTLSENYQTLFLQQTASNRQNLYEILKLSLDDLEGEELKQAIINLQENIPQIVPHLLTIQQLKELCQLPNVFQEWNKQREQFLEEIKNFWQLRDLCQTMQQQLQEIEQGINTVNLPKEKLTQYRQQYDNININFEKIRNEIQRIYKKKSCYQVCDDAEITKIYQINLNLINELYQELMGLSANGEASQTLHGMIQRISNKITVLEKGMDQPEIQATTFTFLGDGRCLFIGDDYKELAEWLYVELDEDQFQDRLKTLDIETEEKLYQHGILPRQLNRPFENDPAFQSLNNVEKEQRRKKAREDEKTELKKKLYTYIKANSGGIRARIYSTLSTSYSTITRSPANISGIKASLHLLSINVSKLIYRLSTMGMILLPIYFCPVAGAVGFCGGFVFFVLRHFGGTYVDILNTTMNILGSHRQIRWITDVIAGRRLFSFTLNARENTETFSRVDLFAKMRILNAELLLTIFICFFRIESLDETAGLGGLLQGAALARELINIL